MATKPIEKHSQLAQVSVAKAEEIDRVTQNPGGERGALITLINSIYLADIPTDAKRSMTDLLQQLIEHAQLEARFRTLLTKADAAFIKKLEADYPNPIKRVFFPCHKCLFSRTASCLDAFSTYQLNAWLLGMPYQTTDTLEASNHRSSRTKWSFPSDIEQFQ